MIDAGRKYDLEREVSAVRLLGVGMGPALCTMLSERVHEKCALGLGLWLRHVVALTVDLAYVAFTPGSLARQPVSGAPTSGSVFLTSFSQHPRVKVPLVRLVEALRGEPLTVLVKEGSSIGQLPDGITPTELPRRPRAVLRASERIALMRATAAWWSTLRRFKDRERLPAGFLILAVRTLVRASMRYFECRTLFERARPAALVVDYDREASAVPVVLAARSLCVPSATLQHGIINNPFEFDPLVADRILVRGEQSRRQLLAYGVSDERITVVGNLAAPSVVSTSVPNASEAQAVARSSRDWIVLATNHGPEVAERKKLVADFLEATQDIAHASRVIKVHPSEDAGFYASVVHGRPGVRLLSDEDAEAPSALERAAVVVCHNTGFGLDAMAASVPVVVLDTIDSQLQGAADWVQRGGVLVARSSAELRDLGERLTTDAAFRECVVERQSRYLGTVFARTGDAAARSAAAAVREMVDQSGERPPRPQNGAATRVDEGRSRVSSARRTTIWTVMRSLAHLPRKSIDHLANRLALRQHRVQCASPPLIKGRIIVSNRGSITLGHGVRIINRTSDNPVGLPHPTVLSTLNANARIDIADDVGMSGASIVAASGIRIGARTLIGGGVGIWDTDFHPLDPIRRRQDQTAGAKSEPIVIGDDVFVGARAIILKGVTIGDGAVIGAGTVVTKSVSPGATAYGNPMRQRVAEKTGSGTRE